MIVPGTIDVGVEPVDLTEGSGFSAVTVSTIVNAGESVLWLGGVDDGFPIQPDGVVGPLDLGPVDHLHLVRESGSGPVHYILTHA